MLNEWQEFLDYTGLVAYKADGKKDTTWLGRFTFEALREFGGLSRILTILARGFLFHGPDGTELDGQPRERIAYARRGLCAWCSVTERADAKPEWQYRTDFGSLHGEFPALVDKDGRGWFCRHFHAAMAFAQGNPKVVRKAYSESAGELNKKFDAEWPKKVRQFQMPLSSSNADAAWIIRFDDVMADALELGPLRRDEMELSEELCVKIEAVRPKKLPAEAIYTLIAYYAANRPEDSDWMVLPVANFDCWFGDTNFGRKYLSQIPEEIIQRSSSFGVSRYRVLPEFLP